MKHARNGVPVYQIWQKATDHFGLLLFNTLSDFLFFAVRNKNKQTDENLHKPY